MMRISRYHHIVNPLDQEPGVEIHRGETIFAKCGTEFKVGRVGPQRAVCAECVNVERREMIALSEELRKVVEGGHRKASETLNFFNDAQERWNERANIDG